MIQFFTGDDEWQRPQDDYDTTAIPRTHVTYVPPSYDPETPAPVLMMLHGRTSNGAGTASGTEMNTLAARENFIVVYPNGIGAQWNYVRDVPFYAETDYDDTVFLGDLLDDLALDLNIDTTRVYVSGISNGGFMTHRLACEDPERYAAFASVIAQAFVGLYPLCDETPPVPIMMINGTNDTIVPWVGVQESFQGTSFYTIAPVMDTVAFWATHNGCDPESYTITELPDQPDDTSNTQVQTLEFADCEGDGRILLYVVVGGGHTFPGVNWSTNILGETNMDIHAADEIWNFVSQYSKEQ